MAKTTLEQWDETAAGNADTNSINIAENCAAANINNAIRENMAQTAAWLGDDTLASATTTDLGSVPGRYVTVSGTTTITGLGTIKAGTIKYVTFSGALTLTHNATSLILPNGVNITTAAGDTFIFVSEGSGNWRCVTEPKHKTGALRVHRAGTSQNVTAGSTTKVELNNEAFDVDNWYNTTTFRYTPLVAGYYSVSAGVKGEGASTDTVQARIYKNGSVDIEGTYGIWSDSAGSPSWSQASGIIYCNGSSDYIELYAYVPGTVIRGDATGTYLSAVRVA